MQPLQPRDPRHDALELDHMVVQTQPYSDPIADQDAAANQSDPETERALRAMGVNLDNIDTVLEEVNEEQVMQAVNDQDLPHNTPFSAIIEEGETAPGREYLLESDNGVQQLVSIERVHVTVENGHKTRHIEGTVQPLGSS